MPPRAWGDKIWTTFSKKQQQRHHWSHFEQSTQAMPLPGNAFLCLMIITQSHSAVLSNLPWPWRSKSILPALAQNICGMFLSLCRQVDCDKYVYQQISILVDLRLLFKVGLDKDVYFMIPNMAVSVCDWGSFLGHFLLLQYLKVKRPQKITLHSFLMQMTQIWILKTASWVFVMSDLQN